MSDLIKREDAIEAVRYLIYDRQEKGAKPFKWWFIKQRLNAIPTADAISRVDVTNASENLDMEEVSADAVQGELKYTITGQPYCSNCEYVFGEGEEFSPFWDYCPMCGARMTKGGDDE